MRYRFFLPTGVYLGSEEMDEEPDLKPGDAVFLERLGQPALEWKVIEVTPLSHRERAVIVLRKYDHRRHGSGMTADSPDTSRPRD